MKNTNIPMKIRKKFHEKNIAFREKSFSSGKN